MNLIFIRFLIFPFTMSVALFCTWCGFAIYDISPVLAGSLAVLVFGFVLIPIIERLMPYKQEWGKSDNDIATDIINLFTNIGVTSFEKPLLVALLLGLTTTLSGQFNGELWPGEWPILVQLFLMLLIAEFGRYWVHFAAHKVPFLWRLHAIHHSPNRLYFLNAARFHPIEKFIFQLPEVVPFILLGTDTEVIALYLVFNTIHGLFQHSNIDLRLGWLNYVFSMSELHRWHHSKRIDESDRNFGNNLIVWDLIFGTFYYPKGAEVGHIGLQNPKYPKTYIEQLLAPFAKSDLSKLRAKQNPHRRD